MSVSSVLLRDRRDILAKTQTDMADEDQELVFVPEPDPTHATTPEAVELEQDIEQLEEIKTDLQDLKQLTGSSSAWFLRGVLQGAGAIIGSIAMLIALTWLLSVLGVIPGASELSDFIREYLDKVSR